jgi:FAD/FMN-containing dehydrogenase
MVAIAKDIAQLVARYGGALSGEHGDGRVRSPLLGGSTSAQRICDALRAVKARVRPAESLLNPGNIVDTGPAERVDREPPRRAGRPRRCTLPTE